MSTADSQVLACTAAITDDIKPNGIRPWQTKKVTLVIAAFATSIFSWSISRVRRSFALVVFAVYGLGGIIVPLILIRMAGYEPDSRHTISMMIAALLGVLVWTVLGYGEYVFPSVPGMGAAFAVHFAYCWKREDSNSNPFGRYSVPTRKISAIGAVVLLAVVGVMEGSYQAFSPSTSSMSDKVGSYSISGTYSFHEIAEGSEFIEDGESIPIDANSEDSVDPLDGLNIVGVLITIAHQDDETVNGAGCAFADPPQDDTVEGSIGYSGLSASDSSTGDFAFQLDWHNSSLIDTTVSNMTKSEIQMMLDGGGLGLGDYELILGVTVQNGGGAFCTSDDTGQDVDYKIELVSLEYTITAV